jgi:tRNA threonylcarbamoyladenosine biosynthesis protein TsaE
VVKERITSTAEETIALGREIAAELKAPVLVLLYGELGSGKTTLAKGIVSGLGAAEEDEVTSPTFTLVHVYGKGAKVHHADLYRIESAADFESLGMEDVFAEPGVVILEWPERVPVPGEWPQVRIRLEHLGGERRRIRVTGGDDE